MSKNDGGPAYPFQSRNRQAELNSPEQGMSLRDYFAGQALAGLCADTDNTFAEDVATGIRGGKFVVGAAYKLADAMLAEQEKSYADN